MGTLTYDNTITNAEWFDASLVMSNFLQARNMVNGNLVDANFSDAMTPSVNSLQVSEEITGVLIEPAGDFTINIPEGREMLVRLESDGTAYMTVDANGVRTGT